MNIINSLKNNIPLPVRLFLGKALLFFIVWKLLYSLFLFDSQILDTPLTIHLGKVSSQILNNTGLLSGFTSKLEIHSTEYAGETTISNVSSIYHNGKKVLLIAHACNGLELIALYIGFIVCMPSSFLRKLKYVFIGVIMLDFINIFRCVGLIYLREYFEIYFQFAHHYLFKMMIYLSTFSIWMFYSRKIKINN